VLHDPAVAHPHDVDHVHPYPPPGGRVPHGRAVVRAGPLRQPAAEATDAVWALASPELYTLLTGARGWSRARWTRWLADSLAAILLPEPDRPM
jgi:hypothetical protein